MTNIDFYKKYDTSIKNVETIISSLESVKTKAENLKSRIEGMAWRGQHRDHSLTLFDLTLQYHNKLIDITKDIKEGMNEFKTNYESLESTEQYTAVKGFNDL